MSQELTQAGREARENNKPWRNTVLPAGPWRAQWNGSPTEEGYSIVEGRTVIAYLGRGVSSDDAQDVAWAHNVAVLEQQEGCECGHDRGYHAILDGGVCAAETAVDVSCECKRFHAASRLPSERPSVHYLTETRPDRPGDVACAVCGAAVDTGDAELARLREEITAHLAYREAAKSELTRLRAQLDAKPQPEQQPDDAFLQYCLTAGVPDTCRPYCMGAFNEGARFVSRQAKPQPAGLPYTLDECADRVDALNLALKLPILRDVVTSLRGMAK